MTGASAAGLPRMQPAHQLGGQRRSWWLAAGIALAANLVIVVLLGQVSRLAPPTPPAVLAVQRLSRIETDPPPPEVRATPAGEAVAEAAIPAAPALALPLLDLPAIASAGLALPMVDAPGIPTELPVLVPVAMTAAMIGEVSGTGAAEQPMVEVDSQATRQGDFDLDRYYPRAAKARAITGTSRIRSRIDAQGRVLAVEILDSRPAGVFDQAAERLGLAQRYAPARRGGRAVPTILDTVIAWKIR